MSDDTSEPRLPRILKEAPCTFVLIKGCDLRAKLTKAEEPSPPSVSPLLEVEDFDL